MRYYRMNFGGADEGSGEDGPHAVPDVHVRVADTWLEDDAGERTDNVEQGQPIRLNVVLEALRELSDPIYAIHVMNADGTTVFGHQQDVTSDDGGPVSIPAGGRLRIAGEIENPLVPGRYSVNLSFFRQGSLRGALQVMHLPDFLVYGTRPAPGVVSVRAEFEATPEREPQP